jgi:hypothetical protein
VRLVHRRDDRGRRRASAATVSWDGEGAARSGTTQLNWSGNALPAAMDDAGLTPPAGTTVVFAGSDSAIRRLDVQRALRLASGHLERWRNSDRLGDDRARLAGVISAAGGLELRVSVRLRYLGGVIEGPVTVRNGTLELGPSGEAARDVLCSARFCWCRVSSMRPKC